MRLALALPAQACSRPTPATFVAPLAWASWRSVRECNPDRRVIARLLPAARGAIDAGAIEARGEGRAQEEVVDAQAGVAHVGVPEIIPERVDALAGMKRPERVGPALRGEAAK